MGFQEALLSINGYCQLTRHESVIELLLNV